VQGAESVEVVGHSLVVTIELMAVTSTSQAKRAWAEVSSTMAHNASATRCWDSARRRTASGPAA